MGVHQCYPIPCAIHHNINLSRSYQFYRKYYHLERQAQSLAFIFVHVVILELAGYAICDHVDILNVQHVSAVVHEEREAHMTQTISKKRVETIILPGNINQEKRIAINYASTLMCTTCEEEIMQRVQGTRVYICEQCGAVEYR
jgi:hypothetical protein